MRRRGGFAMLSHEERLSWDAAHVQQGSTRMRVNNLVTPSCVILLVVPQAWGDTFWVTSVQPAPPPTRRDAPASPRHFGAPRHIGLCIYICICVYVYFFTHLEKGGLFFSRCSVCNWVILLDFVSLLVAGHPEVGDSSTWGPRLCQTGFSSLHIVSYGGQVANLGTGLSRSQGELETWVTMEDLHLLSFQTCQSRHVWPFLVELALMPESQDTCMRCVLLTLWCGELQRLFLWIWDTPFWTFLSLSFWIQLLDRNSKTSVSWVGGFGGLWLLQLLLVIGPRFENLWRCGVSQCWLKISGRVSFSFGCFFALCF